MLNHNKMMSGYLDGVRKRKERTTLEPIPGIAPPVLRYPSLPFRSRGARNWGLLPLNTQTCASSGVRGAGLRFSGLARPMGRLSSSNEARRDALPSYVLRPRRKMHNSIWGVHYQLDLDRVTYAGKIIEGLWPC